MPCKAPKGIYKGDVIWKDTISQGKSSFQPSSIQGANCEFSGGVNFYPSRPGNHPKMGHKIHPQPTGDGWNPAPVEGKVVFPIIYRVSAPSKRWLVVWVFSHQQYRQTCRTFKPPGMHLLLSLEMEVLRLGVFQQQFRFGRFKKRKWWRTRINVRDQWVLRSPGNIRLYQVSWCFIYVQLYSYYSLSAVVVTLSGTFALLKGRMFLIGTFKKGRTKQGRNICVWWKFITYHFTRWAPKTKL